MRSSTVDFNSGRLRGRTAALPVLAVVLVLGAGFVAGCGGGGSAATTTSQAATAPASTTPTNSVQQSKEVDLRPGQSHTFVTSDFDHGGIPVVCTSNGTRLNVAIFKTTTGRTIAGNGPVLRIRRRGVFEVTCLKGGKNVAK